AGFLLRAVRGMLGTSGAGFVLLPLVRSFCVHLGASIVMGGVCYLSYRALGEMLPDDFLAEWLGRAGIPIARALKTSLYVVEGVLVLIVIGRIFRIAESVEVFELFRKKLKNKLSGRSN